MTHVLDSSALLALILNEAGADVVRSTLDDGAYISSVNLAETIAKLLESQTEAQTRRSLITLKFETIPFDGGDAWRTANLRATTRSAGLSLGGRACLALALRLGLPAVTADRRWLEVNTGVEVVLCR